MGKDKPKKGVTAARMTGARAAERMKDAGEAGKGEEQDPGVSTDAADVGDAVTALMETLTEDND